MNFDQGIFEIWLISNHQWVAGVCALVQKINKITHAKLPLSVNLSEIGNGFGKI